MGENLEWISYILHKCWHSDRLVGSIRSSTDKHRTVPPWYWDLPSRLLVHPYSLVGVGLEQVQLHLPFCPQALSGVSFLLFLLFPACPPVSLLESCPLLRSFLPESLLEAPDISQSPALGSCRTVLPGTAVFFSICLTICFSLFPEIV